MLPFLHVFTELMFTWICLVCNKVCLIIWADHQYNHQQCCLVYLLNTHTNTHTEKELFMYRIIGFRLKLLPTFCHFSPVERYFSPWQGRNTFLTGRKPTLVSVLILSRTYTEKRIIHPVSVCLTSYPVNS